MDVSRFFLQTVPNRCSEINNYITKVETRTDSDAWNQLKRLFHSLKSSAIMAGFSDLSILAKQAERISDMQRDAQILTHLVDLMNDSMGSPDFLMANHPRFQYVLNEFRNLLGKDPVAESTLDYECH